MGNYLTSCIKSINTLGSYPKVMKCKFCHQQKWRKTDSVEFFEINGCRGCRARYQYNNINLDIITEEEYPSIKRNSGGRYNTMTNISLNSPARKSAFIPYQTHINNRKHKEKNYNSNQFEYNL